MAEANKHSPTAEHPRIAVQLTIEPPTLTLGGQIPTIHITATLLGVTRPITIFAYDSIFNLHRAKQRGQFTCKDITTGKDLRLEVDEIVCRRAVRHYKGHPDEKHHKTLKPGEPRTFAHTLGIPSEPGLQAGHRYSFGAAGRPGVGWWCWGPKGEVLREKAQPRPESEAERIVFEHIAPVEFSVEASYADTATKYDTLDDQSDRSA